MEEEIWKPIKDYEGYYEVSNLGRIRSLDREVVYNNGRRHIHKGKILNPSNSGRYLHIELFDINKKKKDFLVHRLVALAFIPNPDDKPYVDHINTITSDNRVENLRWVTEKENSNNELTRKHMSENTKGEKNSMYGKTGELHPNSRRVYCIELDRIFNSITEATKELNLDKNGISNTCRGRQKSCGKHPITGEKLHWKYV